LPLIPQRAEPQAPRSERQEDLLEQLEELFARQGFRELTMADLSSRLHCSRRTLYELAGSKEDLVALVVERFLDRNFSRGTAATSGHESSRRRLEAFTMAVTEDAQRVGTAFADDLFRTPRTASLLAAYDQRCARLLEEIIQEGQTRGEFRPTNAKLAAEGIMAAVSRIQDTYVLTDLGLNYAQATHEILDLLLYGLGIDPDPGN
jgi:AcrR family transcriptional regulator